MHGTDEAAAASEAAEAVLAARQLALILVVTGAFTPTAFFHSPAAASAVLGVCAAHLVAAALVWRAPWHRWGRPSTAVAGLGALLLLGATTWVSDGYPSALGPLFIVVFAWFGLHHGVRRIALAAPVAALAYAAGLVAVDARPRQVASTLVLIPIATALSLLVSRTVASLRRTQHDLQVKDRWRAALIATLAHDVRSPLTSVLGTLEILEDDPETSSRHHRLLESADRQARRVLRLAMGILEVERVEQGRLRLGRREVDLAALAQDVAVLAGPEGVRVDVAPQLRVTADAERLEQVLYNLVTNALRHGRPPVVVSALHVADRTEIYVTDHGDGVPDADVDQLFDRFSSADHSPHSVGLGLWIVRLLTEAHGGDVRYEAPQQPGTGARFVVSLPRAAVPEAPTPRSTTGEVAAQP